MLLAVILIILFFADSITTDVALRVGLVEGNPNSRIILETYGMLGLYLTSLFLSALACIAVASNSFLSRIIDWIARKETSPAKTVRLMKFIVFLVFFVALLLFAIQRFLVVANNISLIINHI